MNNHYKISTKTLMAVLVVLFSGLAACNIGPGNTLEDNISSTSITERPKNVILLIGDGMGLIHIQAAMITNGSPLQIERFKHLGYSKTYSANSFITDSGAGGTALSTGIKTNNDMVGMGPDSIAAETILQKASRNGLATGIVVSCAVTHATPASFIAHQINRSMFEEIAADFLKTDIDVFIGGGRRFFNNRSDERNLLQELKDKDYQVLFDMNEIKSIKSGRLAGLVYENNPPRATDRGDFLSDATDAAIRILSKNQKGFFLMIEGSQIDWAGHMNDIDWIIQETLDFDKTIGKVLNFAELNGQTLVIVTSDHETGGLTLTDGSIAGKSVNAHFSSTNHTGMLVPVFAYGPGAELFTGFMDNTDINKKIKKLLGLK